MISKRLILLAASGLLIACTPAPPPSSILAPEHVTINLQDIATRFSGKVVPATSNNRKSSILMNGAPEHLQFAFDNDSLSRVISYQHLAFADGDGIRFITLYAMGTSPTTNENMFCTFQGLTSDGRFYISVFYPITAKGLPETAVTLTTTNFLKRLAPADFTPDLAKLDNMIRSLPIVEPIQ